LWQLVSAGTVVAVPVRQVEKQYLPIQVASVAEKLVAKPDHAELSDDERADLRAHELLHVRT
jgi:hypothetical protein